jgi:hypothetical protein
MPRQADPAKQFWVEWFAGPGLSERKTRWFAGAEVAARFALRPSIRGRFTRIHYHQPLREWQGLDGTPLTEIARVRLAADGRDWIEVNHEGCAWL